MIDALTHAVKQMQLTLASEQIQQLDELLKQLLKWNKAFNLTAITDEKEAFKLHLLDSLVIAPFWRFQRTLDVGTGAGFPGLPLAIAMPDREFHLLDSNSKKIRFIRQQIHHLGLTNVTAHHSRLEKFQSNGFDAVVSRAFASLVDMVSMSEHLLNADGRWMAMKGIYSKEEVENLPNWAEVIQVNDLAVPGLKAERCLIEIGRGKH